MERYRINQQGRNQMTTYEKPEVTDYGTLVELTAAGSQPNADVPQGNDGTAFSAA